MAHIIVAKMRRSMVSSRAGNGMTGRMADEIDIDTFRAVRHDRRVRPGCA
jgi:hypothetical protein